jgi:DNA-binding beta-propeller fold protein YncE
VLNSHAAFTIAQSDLVPEGIAWDSFRKQFYLGSTYKPKIVACTAAGDCQPLVREGQSGLAPILGVRVDPNDGTLWAAANGDSESAVWHFAVPSGKPIRKYTLSHKTESHLLNDLVVGSLGDVFVTDTRAGAIYRISRRTDRLELLNPALRIPAANGIAVSDDSQYLYAAGFGDGITVVDLKSGSFRAIAHTPDLCLATIDGLYFYRGSLIAIQNGLMAHRVIRCYFARDPARIARFEVLERRNPLFEGITTGAIADGAFYFMANTQIDKVRAGRIVSNTPLEPIRVLKIGLAP